MLICLINAAKENLAHLLRRIKDSKTHVRKSALQVPGKLKCYHFKYCASRWLSVPIKFLPFVLYVPPQALVGLMKHSVIPLSLENLATLSERCRDPAVSVKKKAMQCVAELLAVSLKHHEIKRKGNVVRNLLYTRFL